jgi:hypothetical protein
MKERSGVVADQTRDPRDQGIALGLWALIVLPVVFALVPIWI